MFRVFRSVLVITLALSASVALAGESSPFRVISDHYEVVRNALLNDTTTGIAEHATAIADQVGTLTEAFDAKAAGVAAGQQTACESLLPEIERAARELAAAKDLEAARHAFAELSKPLVRYRDMVSGDRPMVVYCPMAKESWLQPRGDIGNPYFGQSMARCGKIISD